MMGEGDHIGSVIEAANEGVQCFFRCPAGAEQVTDGGLPTQDFVGQEGQQESAGVHDPAQHHLEFGKGSFGQELLEREGISARQWIVWVEWTGEEVNDKWQDGGPRSQCRSRKALKVSSI